MLVAVLIAVATVGCAGQEIQLGGARAAAVKGHVVLLSDSAEVKAGLPQVVELRFRVDPGFHINSHAPKDGLMIPTVLTVLTVSGEGVKVMDAGYPAGSAFRLEIGEGETLDVYQGEFRVSLRMVVPKGASTLTGALRYQACDRAACFPPRTLPVMVALMGR